MFCCIMFGYVVFRDVLMRDVMIHEFLDSSIMYFIHCRQHKKSILFRRWAPSRPVATSHGDLRTGARHRDRAWMLQNHRGPVTPQYLVSTPSAFSDGPFRKENQYMYIYILYTYTRLLCYGNVCMYVHVYVCVCMYLCMYVCTFMCMYVCMYVGTYVCTYVCMYLCTFR